MPDDIRKAEMVETTVSEVADELARRGLDPRSRHHHDRAGRADPRPARLPRAGDRSRADR